MIANQKYRISALAKDLNMKSTDIINLLKANGFEGRTHMTVLEPDEFSVIMELLTKENQVSNLSAYLAGNADVAEADRPVKKAKKQEKKPEEKKEEPKKAEPKKEEIKKEEPKKAEPKKEASKKEEPKKEESKKEEPAKAPVKEEKPKTAEVKKEERPAPKKEEPKKEEVKKENRPAHSEQKKPAYDKQRMSQLDKFQNRPAQQQANKPADKKKPAQPQQDNRSGVIRSSGTGEASSNSSVKTGTRVIDTRTVSVDLDKYDERLENFVSDTKGGYNSDSHNQKQKFKKNKQNDKSSKNRDKEKFAMEKLKREQFEKAKKQPLHITVPDEIVVSDLAQRLKATASEVIKRLIGMGAMVTVNDVIDFDTAYLVAEEMGAVVTKEVVVTIEERLFTDSEDKEEDLIERPPVVCVMGHVDHGKTSLLDKIRNTHVTSGEAGGITQHIGAYRVNIGGKDITFLDTPGHEAFTAMRARGAKSTDIAILVVAADDGIMPQTIEAINHAKAADISVIVAINKMDKQHANPDAVKQELTKYDLMPEEWGGDTIVVPVSALTGQGIDNLLEMVLLVAEMKELKANPNRHAKGVIIESKLDKGKGPVATVLVQNGTLHSGDVVIAGTCVGRVRAMTDSLGRLVNVAGPSVPVEITGLSAVPTAGDEFNAVEDERMARELAEQRKEKEKEQEFKAKSRGSLEEMFANISDDVKHLNVIIKADVAGSAEAVSASLLKLTNDEVKVNVIHSAAGGIREGDVMLAAASNAIIIGFNVRPDKAAMDSAEREGVDIRTYRIIYECIEEITAAMKGMLAPTFKEVVLGHAEVRQTIHVPNVGTIAGSYVQDGKITRASLIRVVRDGVIIFEDKISSLRRFKDDVREVATGYECGVGLEKFNDIRVGDILEAYIMEEVKR